MLLYCPAQHKLAAVARQAAVSQQLMHILRQRLPPGNMWARRRQCQQTVVGLQGDVLTRLTSADCAPALTWACRFARDFDQRYCHAVF